MVSRWAILHLVTDNLHTRSGPTVIHDKYRDILAMTQGVDTANAKHRDEAKVKDKLQVCNSK